MATHDDVRRLLTESKINRNKHLFTAQCVTSCLFLCRYYYYYSVIIIYNVLIVSPCFFVFLKEMCLA